MGIIGKLTPWGVRICASDGDLMVGLVARSKNVTSLKEIKIRPMFSIGRGTSDIKALFPVNPIKFRKGTFRREV